MQLFADPGSTSYGAIAVVGLGPEKATVNECQCIDEQRENVRVAAASGIVELERIVRNFYRIGLIQIISQ